MSSLENYLRDLCDTRASGENVKETSFYPSLANLFNAVGAELNPKVRVVINIRNRGAGLPDGGLFTAQQLKKLGGDETLREPSAFTGQQPERGVVEVKGAKEDVRAIATGEQVRRYLNAYGQVLVTNLREFLLVTKDATGHLVLGESYALANSEKELWERVRQPHETAQEHAARFTEYLKRVMLTLAPLEDPKDLAWFLASYARDAKARIEKAALPSLQSVREAMEQALEIKFEGAKGEAFFRSTLIQMLFYGVFSAWVLWSKTAAKQSRFRWHEAVWSLHVPVIATLFERIVTPSNMRGLGLTEVLDWTAETLNRVRREEFFTRFEEEHAVQYFYEPFLEAFDPDLRKQLGVWYTPNEIVRYMVERVDVKLRTELNIADGLADERVYVLDPCCGTGAYLVEVLKRIKRTIDEQGGDALAANDLKLAAQRRVFGFEILPAPFVVAHLQLGLLLQRAGSPLVNDERVGVYLTNALTGWEPPQEAKKQIPFEFHALQEERDAAEEIKREKPILVVIGNPPYNAFAGTSAKEEGGIVDVYKAGLSKDWGIKKFNLDDLYIRFFRLAERRIAEKTGAGIVCFISNFSYLSDPSFVVMRERFLREFDALWFDSLNGDSRETGKLTPEGKPDPSVFSTDYNREGIRVGTSISLLTRKRERETRPRVLYRELWGVNKRADLLASLSGDATTAMPSDVRQVSDLPEASFVIERGYASKAETEAEPQKEREPVPERQSLSAHRGGIAANDEQRTLRHTQVTPTRENRFSFRPSEVSTDYLSWAKLTELCEMQHLQGMDEDRANALIDFNSEELASRMKKYFDKDVEWNDFASLNTGLSRTSAAFEPHKVREKAQTEEFDKANIRRYLFRPSDIRWCYSTAVPNVWKRSRPELKKQNWEGNSFLLTRAAGVAKPEGVPFLYSKILFARDCMKGHAVAIPLQLRASLAQKTRNQKQHSFLSDAPQPATTANLSARAREYLAALGITDADKEFETAALVWQHALAIGYAPAYLAENADGIRADWPRVPLPASLELLEQSAALGREIAALLDTETQVAGVTTGRVRPELRLIANIRRADGAGSLNPDAGDLAVRAGWGHRGQGGVVMPGKGRRHTRAYAENELASFAEVENVADAFGAQTHDVCLNDIALWSNIPARVWDYTIGGYQVIKKWLSYREQEILRRGLNTEEAREVTGTARRIAAILLLEAKLNENYERSKADSYAW